MRRDQPLVPRTAGVRNSFHELGLGAFDPGACAFADHDDSGNPTSCSAVPIAVAGGLAWREVQAGMWGAACGIANVDKVYCWGDAILGSSSSPIALAGGLSFAHLATGWAYGSMCGVTTGSIGYCWGSNSAGQLGNGTLTNSPTPTPVAGGFGFSSIAVGGNFACGISSAGSLYCWGLNDQGQLGNGTTFNVAVPVKVAGQP